MQRMVHYSPNLAKDYKYMAIVHDRAGMLRNQVKATVYS